MGNTYIVIPISFDPLWSESLVIYHWGGGVSFGENQLNSYIIPDYSRMPRGVWYGIVIWESLVLLYSLGFWRYSGILECYYSIL